MIMTTKLSRLLCWIFYSLALDKVGWQVNVLFCIHRQLSFLSLSVNILVLWLMKYRYQIIIHDPISTRHTPILTHLNLIFLYPLNTNKVCGYIIVATRADRLVRLEFAKNQYHRFSIALFIHLFLFKVHVTGIIRKRINFFRYISFFHLAN